MKSEENEDIIRRTGILDSLHDVKDMDKYSCSHSCPTVAYSEGTSPQSALFSLPPHHLAHITAMSTEYLCSQSWSGSGFQ